MDDLNSTHLNGSTTFTTITGSEVSVYVGPVIISVCLIITACWKLCCFPGNEKRCCFPRDATATVHNSEEDAVYTIHRLPPPPYDAALNMPRPTSKDPPPYYLEMKQNGNDQGPLDMSASNATAANASSLELTNSTVSMSQTQTTERSINAGANSLGMGRRASSSSFYSRHFLPIPSFFMESHTVTVTDELPSYEDALKILTDTSMLEPHIS